LALHHLIHHVSSYELCSDLRWTEWKACCLIVKASIHHLATCMTNLQLTWKQIQMHKNKLLILLTHINYQPWGKNESPNHHPKHQIPTV
jgi:hypothetical protein